MTTPTPTILVVGATGRTGTALIQSASSHPRHPAVHAFARTLSKLSPSAASLCTTLQKGDATDPIDLESALQNTNADVVILSIGVPNSTAKSTVREKSAQALLQVLNKPRYNYVKVVVISAVGAGGSRINVGWGIGSVVSWILKDILADHDRQEEILSKLGDRVSMVRPMGLGEGSGSSGVQQFVGKSPNMMIQRSDLADWVIERVAEDKGWGDHVNVTGCGGEESIFGYVKRELF